MKTASNTIVNISYIIDCRHCGRHTEYATYAALSANDANDSEALMQRVDTECAIRCPACRSRLNITERDFREQVRAVRRV
ncbi:MAG: hypothetical protein IJD53_05320 [Alistipes sp.]|nr:hypothetical protein [Alistipes sp.]